MKTIANSIRTSIPHRLKPKYATQRWQSSVGAIPERTDPSPSIIQKPTASPLACLPTSSIIRTLVLGTFFTSPLLFKPGFAILQTIANSTSRFLNPDLNPLLRALIKPLVYDQFCAGRNESEVRRRVQQIKSIGFSGVILGYGREIEVQSRQAEVPSKHQYRAGSLESEEIMQWKKGNMQTLGMIGRGDFINIKFTGAGQHVTNVLMKGEEPPPAFAQAMDEIARQAQSQGTRLWVDAEQQVFQGAIDRWTINLMRKHNTGGEVLVYNTIQAYLKESRNNLMRHLREAKSEGFSVGIKLVRGAYIGSEVRTCICDTKADTDHSYNSIVKDLLTGENLGMAKEDLPRVALFLAGHNAQSIETAAQLMANLSSSGKLQVVPEFGQLLGMADDVSCNLLQKAEELRSKGLATPWLFKALPWGSVQECMRYLVRRVVENQGAAERMRDAMPLLFGELRRRAMNAFR